MRLSLDDSGHVESFVKDEPADDYISEAIHAAKVAHAHNQIAMAPGQRREKQFVTDPQGRKVLKRMRFSAR